MTTCYNGHVYERRNRKFMLSVGGGGGRLWNVSCEAYHKKNLRQNSLLKMQEILKRDMDMDITEVCIVLKLLNINNARSMLKNYDTLNKCIFVRIFVDAKIITY